MPDINTGCPKDDIHMEIDDVMINERIDEQRQLINRISLSLIPSESH